IMSASGRCSAIREREETPMPDWMEIMTRLAAAALVGGGIGLNRHFHHKSAGLRTLSLVSCGAAGLVLASLHRTGAGMRGDAMSPAIQGTRPGVGFIGAGVIVRNPAADKVQGLTTAAAVWITAALGALCGIGEWKITVTLTALVALILMIGGPLER